MKYFCELFIKIDKRFIYLMDGLMEKINGYNAFNFNEYICNEFVYHEIFKDVNEYLNEFV